MHPPILKARPTPRRVLSTATRGAALATTLASMQALGAPPGLPAECPAAASALVEHFIGADCLACWQAEPSTPGRRHTPGAQAIGPDEWSLDWIVPSTDGAAMAAGALPEAADRLARLGPRLAARLQANPAAFDTATMLAQRDPKRRFSVHASLPYQGYLGVQMHAQGVWPVASSGWIALVEMIPAGTRGSRLPRRLVRVLVGPLALPAAAGTQDAVAPLFGLRWPANAHPENLVATAWVEGRDGRILQIATDRCDDPQ